MTIAVYWLYRQSSNELRFSDTPALTAPPIAPSILDEQAAIEQSLAGDLDAFNFLVEKYQRLAYSVAYRLMQSPDAAADAVQESFIKAFRALATFKGGLFKSWLLRIVVNTCYDMLRVQRRYVVESIGEEPDEETSVTYLVDPGESPHDYAERMELSDLIELGISRLPPDQRLVITLCDVHGYAYEEITEITGFPMGTVKSRISRARTKLRDYLLEQPELLPASLRPKHR
jgi:RNA polymerase sigma-70 factor (ECF subfamily)